MAAETRNGGISLNNNNNCKDHSRRKLLVGVDLFCLFLGKRLPRFHVGAVGEPWLDSRSLFTLDVSFVQLRQE